MEAKLTRRIFLRRAAQAAALAMAGAASAACQAPTLTPRPPATVAPTQASAAVATVPATKPPATVAPTAAPTKALLEITVARSEHPSQPIIQDAPTRQAVLEHTGIKIKWLPIPAVDWGTKLNTWLAANQMPDLALAGVGNIQSFAPKGVVKPINALIDKVGPNLKKFLAANSAFTKKFTLAGEYYYIPGHWYNFKMFASQPMIRMDVLQKLNLSVPTTMDDLYEVLKAFKKAYPQGAIWTSRGGTGRQLAILAYPMGAGYGMYYDKDIEGGKWLHGGANPDMKEVLSFMARCYKEQLLDPDYLTTTTDQWHQKHSTDSAFWTWENMSFATNWNKTLRAKNPEATWAPFPTLKHKKWARNTNYELWYEGWIIGAGAKDPERLVQLMDWMITPEGLDLTNWGIEGKHYTLKAPRPKSIDDYTFPGIDKAMDNKNIQMLPEVVAKYAQKSDPYRSCQSETGTGLLDFTVLYDGTLQYLWDKPGEQDAWYEMIAKDKALHSPWIAPPFTADEQEKLKTLNSAIGPILDPAYEKVVLGRMTLAEFDAEAAKAVKAGVKDLEKVWNDAEARLK